MPFIDYDENMINEPTLLEAGVYNARVASVNTMYTKSGDEMLVLNLNIDGSYVQDVLVFSERAMWKIHQFIKSTGMASFSGQSVEVTDHTVMNKRGRVEIEIEKYEDRNGNERKKNRVRRWIAPEGAPSTKGAIANEPTKTKTEEPNDEMPF